ncbi:tRNA (adenosine(37)-N6)-threonylcarbamoyltransferase complex dimerization subunit type 1 TsaB [Cellulomonas sp. KH9]|uniref:tRNA (adenosine(37)-N6)-threonylcarbamoyltransferase complex dimerization subunit type 1 TsaB n=1 Tax=Cellulomonas sp. KH9 TaxID=1855324 RepID=UPI0008E5BD6F|nr:tRNA (adenosine(37)-N6)-threonylcarbamoyltransferase complex dimerization subunit type 1 TsaB [Cellulomonas sp. KH9]SFJ81309.1 tRNA threonylcarbamoyladenosine biosynthesis protein TsaB [Cellulomonas sp. KH9]
MKRYLGIDTSGAVSAALVTVDGDHVHARSETFEEPRRHAERLAPIIERALELEGADRAEVRGIAVGTGPAPFTGLRAGLVTARVLGLALGVPVWGVPGPDAIAAAAAAHGRIPGGDVPAPGALPDGTPVLVVTDARRREVYWARYEVRGSEAVRVAPPSVGAPADVPRTPDDVVLGTGCELYPEVFGPPDERFVGAPQLRHPDPFRLVLVALARDAAGEPQPTEPLYLRRPDAVPPAGAKRVLA